MREHKYRAWNGRKYIYSHTVKGKNRLGWFFSNTHTLPKEQYTGLKDKNGVEIYESDLIKSNRTGLIYKIVWDDNEDARFVGVCIDQEKDFIMCAYSWSGNEVIGNIYEPPDLLEGK